MTSHYPLDLAMLSVEGEDREKFTQGLVTVDVNALTPNKASLAACCDIKGRMVANFLILKNHTAIHFILPKNNITTLDKHLRKYALFSKITLSHNPWYFSGIYNTENQKNPNFSIAASDDCLEITYPDQRLLVCAKNPIKQISINENDWQLADIQAGIASITPKTSGLFTPQMIHLDKLGGVSFNKGCYLGQEIIARTQHLGKLKRHLHQVEFVSEKTIESGAPIINADGDQAGYLINYAKKDKGIIVGLAVIEDRMLTEFLSVNHSRMTMIDSDFLFRQS